MLVDGARNSGRMVVMVRDPPTRLEIVGPAPYVMPEVVFAPAIQRHQLCPACRVEAATVRAALDQVFAGHPALRDYIVDEQGALRRHVAVFVDGEAIRDRRRMSDAVAASAQIYVVQALSGG